MAEAVDLMITGPVGRLSVRTKGLESKPKNVIILCHGANASGQMGFDFSAPGLENYSLMDALVDAGIGAVTFSVRGYRLSDALVDPLMVQTDQAIEDVHAVVDWARHQGFPRPHLLGWSWGGRVAGRYVEQHPDRIDRLVLLGPALGGGNTAIFPAPAAAWHNNTYASFIDRLEVACSEPEARIALAKRMEAEEPRSPSGIFLENSSGSIPIDPTAVTRPTLMIYGSLGGIKPYMLGRLERLEFFRQLATDDKQFKIIPGGGDYIHLEFPRQLVHKAIADFLK